MKLFHPLIHSIYCSILTFGLASPFYAQTLPKAVDPSAASNPKSVPSAAIDAEDHRRMMADRSEWNKVRAAHRKDELINPLTAIAAYQSFITSRNWHPSVVITASDVVARIYLLSLKDAKHAQEIYTWLESHHGENADMA